MGVRLPRFRALLLALLSVGLLPQAVSAQQGQPLPGERLFLIPPTGWVIAFHDRQGNVELTELVPQGQNIQNWKEMLTVQLINGKPESSPADVLKGQVEEVQQACDDVGAGAVSPGMENGYETALRAIACTRSKQWGKGELNLYKVIRGRERLYVISRSWRGEPFEKDKLPVSPDVTKQWLAFMQQVRVCDGRDAQHACPDTSTRSSMH